MQITRGTVPSVPLKIPLIQEKGFDFVELSGGSYEKLAFNHIRESTKQREAFFLEFADEVRLIPPVVTIIFIQLRQVFQKTIIYVTGGFRTAAAMVRAVKDGSTDGIGLARPVTAEPGRSLPSIITENP